MDIYGMGVLIQGDSGIGKVRQNLNWLSVAIVWLRVTEWISIPRIKVTLWGEPAEILRHLLEIRGVGIIDVMSLYGASAVKDSSSD